MPLALNCPQGHTISPKKIIPAAAAHSHKPERTRHDASTTHPLWKQAPVSKM